MHLTTSAFMFGALPWLAIGAFGWFTAHCIAVAMLTIGVLNEVVCELALYLAKDE